MNPDDLKALLAFRARLTSGGVPAIPPAAPADVTSTANQMPPDAQLAAARQGVLKARAAGYSEPEIDQFVRQKYGTPLALIMTPQQSDFMRSMASGATLGFNDELTGAAAKLLGGNYAQARDQVRSEQAAASAVAPKRMAATEIAGGALPGVLTGGLVNPAASALGRVAQASAVGAGLGGAAGLGHSDASTVSGALGDTENGAVKGLVGGALLASAPELASFLRNRGLARVAQDARYVLPSNAAETVARQEAMAPGTAVLADRSPETIGLARGVGSDLATASAARDAADARVQALDAARQRIGQQYQVLEGQKLPVDDDLRKIVGGNLMLPGRAATPLRGEAPSPLYHETSPESAVAMGTAFTDLRGIHVTPHQELALGQGGKGATVEFGNPDALTTERVARPGGGFVGDNPDQRVLAGPPTGQQIIRSITFKPGSNPRPYLTRRLTNMGWTAERDATGAVSFTNPHFVEPNAPTPELAPGLTGPAQGNDQGEVSFGDLQSLRSDLSRKLRAAQKAYAARGEQGNVIADLAPRKAALDQWLQGQVPGLSQVDNDYAFAMNRFMAAKDLRKAIGKSLTGNAAVDAAGFSAGSPAAQIPTRAHLVSMIMDKVVGPNPATRAKLISQLLLSPQGASTVLNPAATTAAGTGPYFGLGGGVLGGLSDWLTR